MERIIENLKDPSWWFTAVIVAIVASLLADSIKSLISRLLSMASDKYRKQHEEYLIREQQFIQRIADDQHLLTLYFLSGISFMLFFFFLVTTLLLIPIWGNSILPSVFVGRENLRQILITLILGIPAASMGYRCAGIFGEVAKGIRIYNKMKKEKPTAKIARKKE